MCSGSRWMLSCRSRGSSSTPRTITGPWPRRTSMPADALGRLDAALSEAAGVPVELERPSDAAHGDYATSVALRLARERKRPPRELAAELVEAFAGADAVEQA